MLCACKLTTYGLGDCYLIPGKIRMSHYQAHITSWISLTNSRLSVARVRNIDYLGRMTNLLSLTLSKFQLLLQLQLLSKIYE
jgi:hypothetical protein